MSWGAGWVVTPWFLSQKVLSSVQRTFDECGLFSLPDFEDLINAFRILMSSIFSPGEQEPEAETFLDLWHAPRFSLPAILGPGHINTCKGTTRGRGGDRLDEGLPGMRCFSTNATSETHKHPEVCCYHHWFKSGSRTERSQIP